MFLCLLKYIHQKMKLNGDQYSAASNCLTVGGCMIRVVCFILGRYKVHTKYIGLWFMGFFGENVFKNVLLKISQMQHNSLNSVQWNICTQKGVVVVIIFILRRQLGIQKIDQIKMSRKLDSLKIWSWVSHEVILDEY